MHCWPSEYKRSDIRSGVGFILSGCTNKKTGFCRFFMSPLSSCDESYLFFLGTLSDSGCAINKLTGTL
jgi:hypothetical protein